MYCSEFVDEVLEGGNTFLESFSLSDSSDEFTSSGCGYHWVSTEFLPMVEDALRESTAGGGSTESLGETERFSDGEMCFHVDEGSSVNGLFTDNNTTTSGKAVINGTNAIFGALDLNQEDGFLETRSGGDFGSVEDTSGSGDNLTTTSVDSIGMEGNIMDVETDSSHVFFGHNTFFGSPLEGSFHGVLNFTEILDGLGGINEKVGTSGLGSEAPNF